jgi:hypothetical protein
MDCIHYKIIYIFTFKVNYLCTGVAGKLPLTTRVRSTFDMGEAIIANKSEQQKRSYYAMGKFDLQ